LNIKDVTTIVKNQMKLSDMIYQEAIENNYSHEQMTPLNLLKANTSIIKHNVYKVFDTFQGKCTDLLKILKNEMKAD
jgi:hypothetical protein